MVLEIALGIVVAYLIIFFLLPIIGAILGGIFSGLFETIGDILGDIFKVLKEAYKYLCKGYEWLVQLKWYKKLMIFLGVCVIFWFTIPELILIWFFIWVYGILLWWGYKAYKR